MVFELDMMRERDIKKLKSKAERDAIRRYKRISCTYMINSDKDNRMLYHKLNKDEEFISNIRTPRITKDLIDSFDIIDEFNEYYENCLQYEIELTEFQESGGLVQGNKPDVYIMENYGTFKITGSYQYGYKGYRFKRAKNYYPYKDSKYQGKKFHSKRKKSKNKSNYDIKKQWWFFGNTYIHNESEYLNEYVDTQNKILDGNYNYNNETEFIDENDYFNNELFNEDEKDFSYLLNTDYCEYEYDEDNVWNDNDIISPDIVTDANNLFDAFIASRKSSPWKQEVQLFSIKWLIEISHLQVEIRTKTYKPLEATKFIISERGKTRVIRGGKTRDRVVEHCLNDNILVPVVRRKIIYDSGASLQGKGVDFTRRRIIEHLTNYYKHYGNEGYILLMDFSKYYDNIQHQKALDMYDKYIDENVYKEKDLIMWLISVIFKRFEVDVSYLFDEEFETCLDDLFNSIDYENTVSESLRTGEKFMRKHLDLGNQTSQTTGIMYTIPITNYIKIVKGEKYYAIYMDDSYVMHPSKEHLQQLLKEIIQVAHENGIFLNERKTRIVKISDYWRFLQIQYSLTDTGRIIRKINPKNLHKQRRRMKSVANILPYQEFYYWANCWLQTFKKYMSKVQYGNYLKLMDELLKKIDAEKYYNQKQLKNKQNIQKQIIMQ